MAMAPRPKKIGTKFPKIFGKKTSAEPAVTVEARPATSAVALKRIPWVTSTVSQMTPTSAS